jgi:hypothetical protein
MEFDQNCMTYCVCDVGDKFLCFFTAHVQENNAPAQLQFKLYFHHWNITARLCYKLNGNLLIYTQFYLTLGSILCFEKDFT